MRCVGKATASGYASGLGTVSQRRTKTLHLSASSTPFGAERCQIHASWFFLKLEIVAVDFERNERED